MNYQKLFSSLSIDQIQFCLSRGIVLHPLLYEHFLFLLQHLEIQNRVSLMPLTILQNFNNRLKKIA